MKELLNKISSYNILNCLLPGTLFSVIISEITDLNLIQSDLVIGVFTYYFIGLIISRIGSLIIEPILKKIKFVRFAAYKDFVKVAGEDNKLEILSEFNNMYRTFISMFLLVILVRLYFIIESKFIFLSQWKSSIIIILLLLIFLFSYKKQTKYITKRINSQRDNL
ncbi:MAG: hypothetical protein JRJ49_02285 [Deltaproteobacteria bacterium]|nr:hypothetical protein [Deltaproteobacteria bacterium]